MKEVKEMPDNADVLLNYIREKRHEILNDLQVILGYAQLGKCDKVIEYIHTAIDNINKDREKFNTEDIEKLIELLKDEKR